MDYFARELTETGYLHNHARMWFAGFWIHTEQLPWELGADFFYRHLLDADPASNTLSWRWVAGLQTVGKFYLTRRSNLERFVEPSLLDAHAGGMEKLDDKLAQPARVDTPPFVRAETPDDEDDTALPEDLPSRVGLWVHGDDLCAETATPLAGLRPQGVFGGLGAELLRDFGISEPRREYLRATLRDGVQRAGAHFGGAEAVYEEPESLPDALAAWAKTRGLGAVVAMRPPVGPLLEVVPTVRAALAKENVALHLVWRLEDAATLSFAKSGYFNFWHGAARALLGVAAAEVGADRDGGGKPPSRKGQRR